MNLSRLYARRDDMERAAEPDVQSMLRTSYRDYMRPRLDPVTGKPVWPIERVAK